MLRYLTVYLSPVIPCSIIDPEVQQYIAYYNNYTPIRPIITPPTTLADGTILVRPLITPPLIPSDLRELVDEHNSEDNNVIPDVSQPNNLRRPWNATEGASNATNTTNSTNTSDERLSVSINYYFLF